MHGKKNNYNKPIIALTGKRKFLKFTCHFKRQKELYDFNYDYAS